MSNFIPLPPTYAVTDPQVRAVLDVLSRNMQVVIDAGGGTSTSTNTALTPIGGPSSFGSGVSSTNITNLAPAYTLDTLTADLKRGAAEVITGVTNGTTVMKLEPAGQYVVFQHKDAVILGTTGAYAGTVRTGLGITSTGILGGYNRTSDGVWQTTFAIESSTGNLTLLGTIRAASIISVDAYLGTTLVSDVVNNSAAVTTKLNKSAADILSGTIDFQNAGGFKTGTIAIDGSGNATGAGVAFTSKGIVGRNVSNTTFTIDATTGAATFAGALIAASGSFVGTVAAGGIIADSVTLNSAGGTSLSIIAGQASGALPSASFGTTLQSSLNSGVTNILAGTGSNYRLKVDASLAFIAFQHKDAVYNGTATAGLGILPAVGISAAGIAMGYNDNTGAWNNAVSLSAVGDLTVKGTITAGSIIVGSVTIGAGGTTLTAVESNSSNAISLATTADANATSALTQVTNKLNKNAADILSGDITFSAAGGFKTGTIAIDSSGNATGDGVAFTSKGIVGRTSAATTFTLDATTGAATFKGDITGASGTFTGTVQSAASGNRVILNESSSSYIKVYDGSGGTIFSLLGVSGLYANSTINGASAIAALSVTNASGYSGSVINATNFGSGHGILADSQNTGTTRNGVLAFSAGTGSGAAAVYAVSNGGSFGMYCFGRFGISDSTLVTNLNAQYLNGNLASAFYVVGGALGTPSSGNLANCTFPILNQSTTGNAATATTATNSNALGGVTASSWARIFVGDGGSTANAAGSGMNFNCTISGQSFSGSGNTLTLGAVSDRRLKENIQPETLGLNFINALLPVTYNMIGKQRKAHGFIHDQVAPLISGDNDSLNIINPDGMGGVDYMSLIAPLVKSVQELSAKVTALESANAS